MTVTPTKYTAKCTYSKQCRRVILKMVNSYSNYCPSAILPYTHTHQLGKLDFVRDTQKGWHLPLAIVARENISQTAGYVSTSSSYQSPMAIYHNYL